VNRNSRKLFFCFLEAGAERRHTFRYASAWRAESENDVDKDSTELKFCVKPLENRLKNNILCMEHKSARRFDTIRIAAYGRGRTQ